MPLHVEIELLTGRYVAARFNDRARAEWPPHPARWFSAVVAAWAAGSRSPAEADVLRWLETQGAPTIACSTGEEVAFAEGATYFVPVNDAAAVRSVEKTYATMLNAREAVVAADPERTPREEQELVRRREKAEAAADTASDAARVKTPAGTALALLPEHRGKQPRAFPSVRPDSPLITFGWPDGALDEDARTVLDGLLGRIGRLGHSSSFVSCRVVDVPATAPWLQPDPHGDRLLRTPGPEQFDLLEADYLRHRGIEPRALPAAPQPYAATAPTIEEGPGSHFARRLLVLELEDEGAPSLTAALPLVRALRAALIEQAGDQPPELLAGRDTAGAPSGLPHLALVPLPFVGHRHADGLVKGVGLVLPDGEPTDREATLGVVWRWLSARDGALDVGGRLLRLSRGQGSSPMATLSWQRWTAASRVWTTVTPIALDRWPGDPRDPDPARREQAAVRAADTVARACGHIGLPSPEAVEVRPDAWLAGVPPAHRFVPFTTPNGGPRRALTHAILHFATPVHGPVILGAGRYVGQGLCLPLSDPEADGR